MNATKKARLTQTWWLVWLKKTDHKLLQMCEEKESKIRSFTHAKK